MNLLLTGSPKHITGFLGWWAYQMPITIFHFFEDIVANLENNLKFGANIKLWLTLEPLFGDYGWRGRMVGFLFRTARTFATLIVFAIVIAFGLAAFIGWYLLLPASIALVFRMI